MVSIETFIREYSKEVEGQNAAIFAGAGLSVSAGYVNWAELLREIADELNLSVDKEHDLVSLAQYHINDRGSNRDGLNRAIIEHFLHDTDITENHRILSRLPITSYWTTNYDDLIEKSLQQAGKVADVKHTKDHMVRTVPNRDAVVYKMHGDSANPNDAVIAKDDYETYLQKRGPYITALAGELVSKTFLFLGFSFSDPNMDHVLSRIRSELGDSQKTHYCILRKEQPIDTDSPGDFEYRSVKQQHFIRDLQRYNIQTVLIDSYDQITEILKKIEQVHKCKTVFISGAADSYKPWEQDEALQFCSDLAGMMVRKGFRIVNGLGLGIGSSIVDGALREIYRSQRTKLTDQLLIRPFPQATDAKKLWTRYRKDMLDYAGIAIFVFGNKEVGGELALSNGMREEFEIAISKGVIPIPVGSTGYIAEELWSEVLENFEKYFPGKSAQFKVLYKQLGDKSIDPSNMIGVIEELVSIK